MVALIYNYDYLRCWYIMKRLFDFNGMNRQRTTSETCANKRKSFLDDEPENFKFNFFICLIESFHPSKYVFNTFIFFSYFHKHQLIEIMKSET